MSITTEELKNLAAYKQAGTFKHEIKLGFKGDETSEHILGFVPHRRDLPVSFPVAIAWAWLDRPEDTMRGLADQLNACPDLARRVIAAEKLAILLRATSAMIEDSMKNVRDERGFAFIPGVSDLEITPDGSLKLSHIRAALSEWEALQ